MCILEEFEAQRLVMVWYPERSCSNFEAANSLRNRVGRPELEWSVNTESTHIVCHTICRIQHGDTVTSPDYHCFFSINQDLTNILTHLYSSMDSSGDRGGWFINSINSFSAVLICSSTCLSRKAVALYADVALSNISCSCKSNQIKNLYYITTKK